MAGANTNIAQTLVGTAGDDRLRGGDGDDFLEGLGGDDELNGRGGFDTAIYDGSIWDYYITETRQGWQLDHFSLFDPDTGRDELISIEQVQFNDAAIILGEDQPTVIENPGTVEVRVGETVDFAFRVWDYDHKLNIRSVRTESDVGRLSLTADRFEGRMGTDLTYNMTYDTAGNFGSPDLTYLAEGERLIVTYEVEIRKTKVFETSTVFFFETFDIAVIGVNDAPTLAGGASLGVVEDGPVGVLDLAAFGDDPDTDDDGTGLRYEIVSVTPGFDVSVVGTELRLDPSNLDPDMSADEVLTGSVTLRAVDRHGAVSNTADVALTATGKDNMIRPFITMEGPDYALLGVDPGAAPNLGSLIGFLAGAEVIPILTYSEAADTKVIAATRVAGFSTDTSLDDENGVELLEETAFRTLGGGDALVFAIEGAAFAGFELNDVIMGKGRDVLAVEVRGTGVNSEAIINGAEIETGDSDDQVWLSVASDVNGWITGDIDTGSGRDHVEIRLEDTNRATPGGLGFFDGRVTLGSGDDRFGLTIDAGSRAVRSDIDIWLDAGEGDDIVRLSNAATVPTAPAPDDPVADLYASGLVGSIWLGAGNDTLVLDLNEAVQADADASLNGGDGTGDVLFLMNVGADELSVTAGGFPGITEIELGLQRFTVTEFEELRLADGTVLELF